MKIIDEDLITADPVAFCNKDIEVLYFGWIDTSCNMEQVVQAQVLPARCTGAK